jgi:hypothetical protein
MAPRGGYGSMEIGEPIKARIVIGYGVFGPKVPELWEPTFRNTRLPGRKPLSIGFPKLACGRCGSWVAQIEQAVTATPRLAPTGKEHYLRFFRGFIQKQGGLIEFTTRAQWLWSRASSDGRQWHGFAASPAKRHGRLGGGNRELCLAAEPCRFRCPVCNCISRLVEVQQMHTNPCPYCPP